MMTTFGRQVCALAVFAAGILLAFTASATTIPTGWTCTGTCGTDGADGVVTAPPEGPSTYQWISTNQGTWHNKGNAGVGVLPTGSLGDETNGSTLATSVFHADAGMDLNFYFNYVTSDGTDQETNYADYAWAALFNSSDQLEALLFTARTEPSGSIVPGQGMPDVNDNVTLTPSSVPIQGDYPGPNGSGPVWSPLGLGPIDGSGDCYGTGCGYTGWINADYTIASSGDYYLKIGVVNWEDRDFQSGLAMADVTVNNQPPINTPEPAELGVFGLGVLLIGGFLGLRRRVGVR